jgi:hypothetical protein
MATDTTKQAWARGGLVLAGTLMLIIGAYQIFLGITALVRNQFVVIGPNSYYTVDVTAWGWIHLAIGIVVALAGFFLFTGSTIAKIVGIALVSISALANFFLIPYYPIWSLLLIALDVFAIWAIANVRTDSAYAADERAMTGYGSGYGSAAGGYGTGQGGMQTGERWPAENAPAGRHYASEDVKEGAQGQMGQPGTGQPGTGETAQQAQERAAAAGRTMPPGGNQPPRP